MSSESCEENLIAGLFTQDESDDDMDNNQVIVKYDTYSRKVDKIPNILQLALVQKHHSLWAEFIYNAARILADMIEDGQVNCMNKSCAELGAGAGLPGIIAVLNGAKTTVISDYGTNADPDLLQAINININMVHKLGLINPQQQVHSLPYVFGNPVDSFLSLNNQTKYDILLCADLLFNRSEHRKLLWSIQHLLQPHTGIAYITFSHHDPQKKELDLNFFKLAVEEYHMIVTKVNEIQRSSYPFVMNDGLDNQRGMVYIYTLSIP